MRIVFFILLLSLGMKGFSGSGFAPDSSKVDSVKLDTINYELIVMDPGFETYLITQPSKFYHTQSYYENWNRRFIQEWNYLYQTGRYPELIQSRIDYDPSVDYGLDLNYQLFYYFKFWEDSNHLKLLPDSR